MGLKYVTLYHKGNDSLITEKFNILDLGCGTGLKLQDAGFAIEKVLDGKATIIIASKGD